MCVCRYISVPFEEPYSVLDTMLRTLHLYFLFLLQREFASLKEKGYDKGGSVIMSR